MGWENLLCCWNTVDWLVGQTLNSKRTLAGLSFYFLEREQMFVRRASPLLIHLFSLKKDLYTFTSGRLFAIFTASHRNCSPIRATLYPFGYSFRLYYYFWKKSGTKSARIREQNKTAFFFYSLSLLVFLWKYHQSVRAVKEMRPLGEGERRRTRTEESPGS